MELFKCEYCERIFPADAVEICEEWYGRICRRYKACPYCGNDDFYGTDYPYGNDCKDYVYCDFDCENCNVSKGQNPICKNYEYCDYDCKQCPIFQDGTRDSANNK